MSDDPFHSLLSLPHKAHSRALFHQIKCPLGLPQLFPPGIAFFLSLIVFLVWILTQGQSNKEQQTCYEKQQAHPENP
jgi:hypothetical protein